MLRSARSVLKNKKGVAALEYSILAGMIVLAIVTTLTTTNITGSINTIFTNLNTALTNVITPKKS
jgi:pilus assembly protein Flp/PilA